jgi:lysozyme family protein
VKKSDIGVAALQAGYSVGFRKALNLVLDWECELNHVTGEIVWENVSEDFGGATFAGLLLKNEEVSADPQPNEIAKVYFEKYWTPLNGLPVLVQELVFFEGVNIGIGSAIRYLQQACNDYGARIGTDGVLGDMTRQAAFAVHDTTGLCMGFLQKIRRHYEEIVASRPSQAKFLAGWENRLTAAKSLLA